MNQQLATVPESSPVLAQPQGEVSILSMLAGVVHAGVTPENVVAIEKLVALHERQEAKRAEQEYASAFAAMQAETGGIRATKMVPGNNGEARYHYAPYEEIMATVQPLLRQHGFAITFDSKCSEDGRRVTVACTLMHRGGHSRTTNYTGRIGSGPPKASEAQADGAGYTYAKRFALCAALNITVEQDTDGASDARQVGAYITPQQAAEMEAAIRNAGASRGDAKNILGSVSASSCAEVPAARLHELMDAVGRFAQRRKARPASDDLSSLPDQDF